MGIQMTLVMVCIGGLHLAPHMPSMQQIERSIFLRLEPGSLKASSMRNGCTALSPSCGFMVFVSISMACDSIVLIGYL
jgi:hypothetical protein